MDACHVIEVGVEGTTRVLQKFCKRNEMVCFGAKIVLSCEMFFIGLVSHKHSGPLVCIDFSIFLSAPKYFPFHFSTGFLKMLHIVMAKSHVAFSSSLGWKQHFPDGSPWVS